jgi:transcriptional regulator with XRE-family HTH domain
MSTYPTPVHPIAKTIGKNLRVLRKSKGFTQTRLGDLAGIHLRYVQDIEACRRNPTAGVIQQLKAALGCKWGDLLDRPRSK